MMKEVGRNWFDLSHSVKQSFRMGELVPFMLLESLPGDKWNISVEHLIKMAPMVAPIMHDVQITVHCYFVPTRLLWPSWEDFITGEEDLIAPYVDISNVNSGTIGDYFGLPTGNWTNPYRALAYPFAAYNLIYNEYYRDQNLINPVTADDCANGDNTTRMTTTFNGAPYKRAWNHDYFTSALPFAQKGEEVMIPLGQFTDVDVLLDIQGVPNTGMIVREFDGSPTGSSGSLNVNPASNSAMISTGTGNRVLLDPNGNLKAETSMLEANAASIRNLRIAFATQRFLEKNARGGTRYTEFNRTHYGAIGSDSRLNRPEYIGGAKSRVAISEVLSTAQTDDSSGDIANPVGNYAGHGVNYGNSGQIRCRTEEHGYIIGIINVQPVTAYQQGLHRMWTRFDNLDIPLPSFAHIGEQAIKKSELYIDDDPDVRDETFGYIPQYSEMRYANDRVAGEFKDTLSYWTLGRIFENQPELNEDFINCVPSDRIFSVTDDSVDHLYAHIHSKVGVVRALPAFGTPAIL